jgi:CRISP-associated protein Cas1
MGWRTVVVTKHSKLSYKMEHLVVQTEDEIIKVPISDLQLVLIATTQAVITSHLVMELSRNDIKVVFTDNKQMPIGEFNSYYSNVNRNKSISKQINWKKERKSKLWQAIIQTKIANQAKMLAKYNLKKYDGSPGNDDLEELLTKIELDDATNREAVAARMYFQRLFDTNFNRRNEELVVNGYLNFGYSVLLSYISQEICCAGYLTELGVHHDNSENFYNLSSDLIEPFRVLVDEIAFDKRDNNFFELPDKLELVNLLNINFNTNDGNLDLSQIMKKFVRRCLKYLSEETEDLPQLEIQI